MTVERAGYLSGTELLLTRLAQQTLDRQFCEQSGLPLLLLMEQAGEAVSHWLERQLPAGEGELLFLAGRGGNGGDAYASARQLQARGYSCFVYAPEGLPREGTEAALMAEAYFNLGGRGSTHEADLKSHFTQAPRALVDGLYGTAFKAERGFKADLKSLLELLTLWRERGMRVFAIDLPSGLDCDTGLAAEGVLVAEATLSFVRAKIGLKASPGRHLAGRVDLAPLSFSEDLVEKILGDWSLPRLFGESAVRKLSPYRAAQSHKGSTGALGLWAGSEQYPGALLLATRAALKAGASYLHVLTSTAVAGTLLAAEPAVLLHHRPTSEGLDPSVLDLDLTALAVGPGLGRSSAFRAFLPQILRGKMDLILDADALNELSLLDWRVLARARVAEGLSPLLLTPHPGEFRRLAPDLAALDRQAAARQLALDAQVYVLLKGEATVIAAPDGQVFLNDSGNSALAKAGSGDVLTGLILALRGLGLSLEAAALAGAYLHGRAGERLAESGSLLSLDSADLPEVLPQILRELGWPRTSD